MTPDSGLVHAHITTVRELHDGIGTYGRAVESVCADTRQETNRLTAGAAAELARRAQEHRAAERAREEAERSVGAGRDDERAQGEAHLARCRAAETAARQRVERASRAKDVIDRALRELASVVTATETQTRERVGTARGSLRDHAVQLESYLTRATG